MMFYEVDELESYALAFERKNKLIRDLEDKIQDLYEDAPIVLTAWTTDRIGIRGANVEDVAIDIAEIKDFYQKSIKRFDGKGKVFSMALNTLSQEEKEVIQNLYYQRIYPYGREKLLFKARQKLITFIEHQKRVFQLEQKRMRKEELVEKVERYKCF